MPEEKGKEKKWQWQAEEELAKNSEGHLPVSGLVCG